MKFPNKTSLLFGIGCWLAYLSVLAPLITYAVIRFDALYSPESLTMQPELSQQS